MNHIRGTIYLLGYNPQTHIHVTYFTATSSTHPLWRRRHTRKKLTRAVGNLELGKPCLRNITDKFGASCGQSYSGIPGDARRLLRSTGQHAAAPENYKKIVTYHTAITIHNSIYFGRSFEIFSCIVLYWLSQQRCLIYSCLIHTSLTMKNHIKAL